MVRFAAPQAVDQPRFLEQPLARLEAVPRSKTRGLQPDAPGPRRPCCPPVASLAYTFPFPRVASGSKNIRASEATPGKSRRSPARATTSGRVTTPVAAASCGPFSASFLTSCSRYNGNIEIVALITITTSVLLEAAYCPVLFTELPRGLQAVKNSPLLLPVLHSGV
jgi:hypothetical protein